VLTRIHSSCFTSEVLGSLRCDCKEQLTAAMEIIEKEGEGVIVYLNQEGGGIGLSNKLRAYKLQEEGHDTIEANEKLEFKADLREYDKAAKILQEFKIQSIRLITNNPQKIKGLEKQGIIINERVKSIMPQNKHNEFSLQTKKLKMGHLLG
jgi:GTP cyclohydrolase II